MNYYYAVNGQQNGPVTEEQLAALVSSGSIAADTLVWREGMAEWAPYSSIAGVPAGAPAPAGPAGVVCNVCRQTFPVDQTIKYGTVYVCAGCKPRFVQGLREGVAATGGLEFATIGARFGAKVLDNIILYVVNSLIGVMAGNQDDPTVAIVLLLVGTGIGLTYETVLLGWRGQTLGKMAAGIKVVNPDGSSIGYGKALGRSLAEILSGCLLAIGYIIAFWDDEKRTLHDRMAGTRVIKVRK